MDGQIRTAGHECGGAGCGSGGGVWGNGFTSLRRVVFSFVTVSRASVVVFVCTCTVSSLVLSFLFSGFYVRLLQCVEFPLTRARKLELGKTTRTTAWISV